MNTMKNNFERGHFKEKGNISDFIFHQKDILKYNC